ncbi:hypothetical protein ACOZ4I_19645 (plasmid) [Haloarcula salina]|uniref:hypothetical protein n=1 Tax=Haloarcula salina TaxID=1429914 RepID=UPI003C6EA64B
MTQHQIPTENHQGFNIASTDEAPTGPVLLIERQEAHDRFHNDHPRQLTVLLRITAVKTLVNKGETAESYFGERITVITTTTINDRLLSDLGWDDELALIQQFQPDFHIPCDYPVYKENDPLLRRKHVLQCLKGTIWMASNLYGAKTRIIPLLKGETPHERRLCYQVFQYLGARYCVFYGTQYFTANIGFYQLQEDLRTVVSEAPDLQVMLIGLQATHRLEQLPPQIVAAAGQRWIDEVQLRDIPYKQSQERYTQMEANINGALGRGQMPIMAWSSSEEVTA